MTFHSGIKNGIDILTDHLESKSSLSPRVIREIILPYGNSDYFQIPPR